MSTEEIKLYRYETYDISIRGNLTPSEFIVIKETPKGYWFVPDYVFNFYMDQEWVVSTSRRWTSKVAKRRYAYPSEKEALGSFIARKNRQILLLEEQLMRAKDSLHLAMEVE